MLFQGPANPSFSASPNLPGSYGADPSQVNNMPPVIAPSQNSRGFTPVNNLGVPRPTMSPMQPPSPVQTAPVQPSFTSAAPPPTVQTVDTSNVPGMLLCSFILICLVYFAITIVLNLSQAISSVFS